MHTMVHENIKKFMEGFTYDAHPMGVFISTVGAMSTFYPDGKQIFDAESRQKQIHRLIAKTPTIAAYAYRHSIGRPYVYPGQRPQLHRQLPEHAVQDDRGEVPGRTRSSSARSTCCSSCTPTTSRTARTSAMRAHRQLARRSVLGAGRCGGGALRPAARRRQRSGAAHAGRDRHRCENIPGFIKRVKAGEGRLMGFGHRVYKSYDPRAKIIKRTAYEVFEVTGKNPLLDIALELERIALEDEYFVSRKLYPERRLLLRPHLPGDGLPGRDVPGAVRDRRARSGWVAQWEEMLLDPRAEDRPPAADLHGRRDA